MNVELSPDQNAFVRRAIEAGRIEREADAVHEALALWEQRERTRSELLALLDEADASLSLGEGRVITERSMSVLADEVGKRGRVRMEAERITRG